MKSQEYDVVVVGGGPGGSSVATLVARHGYRVALLEKETFPRYQIGESLLPATVHGVCRLLGVTEAMERAAFMVKRGGSFRWGTNPVPWNFLFAISPELSGPTSYAYQVERSKFDEILLRNAAEKGVHVQEGVLVDEVIADAERVRGVRYTDGKGIQHELRARYVIDASGNTTRISDMIQSRLRIREDGTGTVSTRVNDSEDMHWIRWTGHGPKWQWLRTQQPRHAVFGRVAAMAPCSCQTGGLRARMRVKRDQRTRDGPLSPCIQPSVEQPYLYPSSK